MSKGSKQRPTNKQVFDLNYDDIKWRQWSEELESEPSLSKEQEQELLNIVKKVKTQIVNEEMDSTQD